LTDTLTDWVHRPDDRKAIAHAGRNEVMAKHLISHRVDTLLKLIDERAWSH
jgi:spore maturation protein CgeB